MAKDKKVLIRVENLKQYFPVKKASFSQKEALYVRANDDITLDIYEGETLGLVGESGCGKSTLGRTLLQLYNQTDGRTMYYGYDIDELAPKYVLKILENLESQHRNLKELQSKEITARKEYESLPEGDEQYRALEKLREAEKRAKNLFLDLAQLIGGFMVADNLSSVSPVLVKEYEATVKAANIKKLINDDQVKLNALQSLVEQNIKSKSEVENESKKYESKIAENQKSLVGIEKEIETTRVEVEKLLGKYRSHPDFEKYEAYRDKGIDLTRLEEEEMRSLRRDLQLIFQDPYSSLNPRLTVGQIVSEGLHAHKIFDKNDKNINEYLVDIMEKCGLASYFIHRYPHQFSGGQRQRIGIARSVALKPKFIVCDEAVSALDVSIQSQIINLLLDLKEQENLTYLFISHDLSVIKYISDRVGVMYLGNIVELAATAELYEYPMHPYTEALLSAIPTTDVGDKKEKEILEGDIPSPIRPPSGCKFHTRCKYATDICKKVIPEFEEARPGHFVACHHKLNADK